MPAIEITTNIPCANMCIYCPQPALLKNYGRKDQYMTYTTFVQCMEHVPRYVEIHFSGMAECFLNPDGINFIKHVHNEGYNRIILYTTLVGLKLDQVDSLANIPFETVGLHLPDNNGYMKCDVDDHYVEVVRRFIELFPKCSKICFGPLHHKLLPIIQREPNSGGLHSRANTLTQKDIGIPENKRLTGKIGCRATGLKLPLDRVELLPNGNVALCCMDYSLKHIIGNLLCSDFNQLFESEEYKRIERGLNDDSIDILCRTCQDAVQIQ